MKILHATSGPLAGNSYELSASTVIGRDGQTDIQLIDDAVSRRHACVVENEDGSHSILDLGSSNGTKVNGEFVSAAKLAPRSRIEIGETVFLFGNVAPEQVHTDVPDIKLTSGPALNTTVMGDASDAVLDIRAAARAAAAEKAKTSASCCDSPLAARARGERWPHCPACGQATA